MSFPLIQKNNSPHSFWVLLLFCLLVLSFVPYNVTAKQDLFDEAYAFSLIEKQVNLGPRPPGTLALQQTRDLIRQEMPDAFTLREQSFDYRNITLVNLEYVWTTGRPDEIYIFGAHYDTRWLTDQDPVNKTQQVLGANDGASGVAAWIAIAHYLVTLHFQNVQFRIVFFDGEDQGNINGWSWIVGSSYYAENMNQTDIEKTKAMILLDMIADKDLDIYRERSSTPWLQNEIWDTAHALGYASYFIDELGYFLIDDHQPFLSKGISALDIIDFDYAGWHTTYDDLNHVSAQSLDIVGETMCSWLNSLSSQTSNTGFLSFSSTTVLTTTDARLSIIPFLYFIPLFCMSIVTTKRKQLGH